MVIDEYRALYDRSIPDPGGEWMMLRRRRRRMRRRRMRMMMMPMIVLPL
jgi:hypothetical protein